MTWNCNCVFKPYFWTANLTRTWEIIQDISYNSDRFWQWQNDTQCRIKAVTDRIILQLIIFCAPLGMHRTNTAICLLILTPWCLSHSKLHAKSIRMLNAEKRKYWGEKPICSGTKCPAIWMRDCLFSTPQQCKITARASLSLRSLYAAKGVVDNHRKISLKGFLLCVTHSVKPR